MSKISIIKEYHVRCPVVPHVEPPAAPNDAFVKNPTVWYDLTFTTHADRGFLVYHRNNDIQRCDHERLFHCFICLARAHGLPPRACTGESSVMRIVLPEGVEENALALMNNLSLCTEHWAHRWIDIKRPWMIRDPRVSRFSICVQRHQILSTTKKMKQTYIASPLFPGIMNATFQCYGCAMLVATDAFTGEEHHRFIMLIYLHVMAHHNLDQFTLTPCS